MSYEEAADTPHILRSTADSTVQWASASSSCIIVDRRDKLIDGDGLLMIHCKNCKGYRILNRRAVFHVKMYVLPDIRVGSLTVKNWAKEQNIVSLIVQLYCYHFLMLPYEFVSCVKYDSANAQHV